MEAGVQNIARASDLLALFAGVAIVRIEREGLFPTLTFRSTGTRSLSTARC